jgi:hypothetical protein
VKPKSVIYQELRSCGNYDHIKIGVEVELETGDTLPVALDKARRFVLAQLEKSRKTIHWTPIEIAEAKPIIKEPLAHNGHRIDWAKKVVADAHVLEEWDRDPFADCY